MWTDTLIKIALIIQKLDKCGVVLGKRWRTHLMEGADIAHINASRITLIICDGGTMNTCFRKNVFSSEIWNKNINND